MYIDVISLPSRRKTHPKRLLKLKCDTCGVEFQRKYDHVQLKRKQHWCSCDCQNASQRKGGTVAERKRQVFQEKYGVDNPQQVKRIKKKTVATNVVRYGSACPMQSEKILDQIEQKYGVRHYIQSPDFLKKAEKTWQEKYGKHPLKVRKIWNKGHQTKKLNGSYATSKAENHFYERLCQIFGNDNVKRQVLIENSFGCRWLIDFRVNDTYVQFDGAYWHGLDRALEEIQELKSPRDVSILAKYETDRRQDEWFCQNDMKLVRIVDTQERNMSDDDIRGLLTK